MKIGSAFPSKWLKADDIGRHRVKVKIESVEMETIGDDDRPVMYFEGKDKGMVLNRTNAGRLEIGFGSDDTDDWIGHEVILYVEPVLFQGRQVKGLRVQVPQDEPLPKPKKVSATEQANQKLAEAEEEEIPF